MIYEALRTQRCVLSSPRKPLWSDAQMGGPRIGSSCFYKRDGKPVLGRAMAWRMPTALTEIRFHLPVAEFDASHLVWGDNAGT